MTETNWKNEYREFLMNQAPTAPPNHLSSRLFSRVHSDLNPPTMRVFGRLLAIHGITGIASLSLCPQFGTSWFGGSGLMNWLMQWGHEVCMLGCGALFVGLSAIVAAVLLKPEELRAIRKNEALQLAALASLSLSAFICLGWTSLNLFSLLWWMGAIVGGLASFELAYLGRLRWIRI